MSYNGWTNYETWNLALWIGNEEGSSEYWNDRARQILASTDEDDTPERRREDAASQLSDELENETKEGAPEVGNGFFGDILTAAIGEVNWYEIAEHWVADVADEVFAEEKENAAS